MQGLLVAVLLPLGLLVLAGARFRRGPIEADTLRVTLSGLVFHVFLPPLMFAIGAATRMEPGLLVTPLVFAVAVAGGGLLLFPLLFWSPVGRRLSPATRVTLLIGGMFGNTFYIGLPVLTHLYGSHAVAYPALVDNLVSTPLIWSLGVWLALRYGGGGNARPWWQEVFRLPPLWAFFVGLGCGALGWVGGDLLDAARFIGRPAVPLMMLVLGLAIPWSRLRLCPPVFAVVLVKLVAMPALAWCLLNRVPALVGEAGSAALVEAAMPSFMLLMVLADRFKLDVEAAALLVGWSTLLFWLTLPGWIMVVSGG